MNDTYKAVENSFLARTKIVDEDVLNYRSVDPAELRRMAEEIARQEAAYSPDNLEALSPEEVRRLVHELRVNQIELEMRNEELRFYSEIMTYIAEAVYFIRMEDGVIVYANSVFEKMFGYEPGEMIGKHVSIVNAPTEKSPEETAKEIMRAINEKGFWQGEVSNIRKDGTLFWCHASVKRFDHSRYGRVILSIHTDITARKQTEEALRESEKLYRSLFEHMLNGFAYCRMLFEDGKPQDFTYLAVNNAFESQTGLKDVVGKRVTEVIPGIREADPWLLDIYGRVSRTGRPERFEMFVQSLQMWFSISVYSPKDEHFVAVFDVITERKLAEEALRQSEERFKFAIEGSQLGYWDWNIATGEVHRNEQWAKMLGYTLQEIDKKTVEQWANIIHPDDREKAWKSIQNHLENRTRLHQCEYRMSAKDGNYKWILDQAMIVKYDPQGRPLRMSGTHTDITIRKNAEEALKESERRFRELLENVMMVAVIFDHLGNITFCNNYLLELTGWGLDEIMERNWFDLFVPSEQGTKQLFIKGMAEKAVPAHHESYIITKRGERRLIAWNNTILRDIQGKTFGSAGIGEDITLRKQAEEEKEQLQAQLQQAQKMESIGILAGGIAHEFNNLLQAISGYTSLILWDKKPEDSEYPNLKAIERAVERAAKLVQQLLLFSRKIEVHRCPVELNQQVEHARRMLERTIPKMIDIEVYPGSRLWTVLADPVQIEQILLNLGSNAADAMPDGGKLIIETENIVLRREQTTHHPGVESGNYVLLTVSDTGQGMDQETVQHIFDPFFTTKGIGQGTGLGLASVYGIVKSHGGYITCQSSLGQGTAFKIYLPVSTLKDIPANNNSERQSPLTATETILLADDEAAIRDFASRALQRFGYKVITAASGEEALETFMARKGKIDLVLLDIGMPGMGGHRCLQELLKIDQAAKVVIASGYSADGRVKKSLEAGAAGFIGKPYQLNDLLSKVRTVLDGEE
ncbi:MAG: PAS domain S-box protein [Deltaproteobacteria bacterium]|nr:PAS domain S-box protein [Deltaproteobacteria bacterium]